MKGQEFEELPDIETGIPRVININISYLINKSIFDILSRLKETIW